MGDTDVALLARRRQTRWWWRGFVLYVVVIPVAAVVGYVVGGGDWDHGFWLFLLFMTGAAVLYGGLLLAFKLWRRGRGARWAQPPLMLGADRSR